MAENENKKQPEIIEYINDFPTKEEEERIEREKNLAEENFQKKQIKSEKRKKIFMAIGIILVVTATLAASVFIFLTYIRSMQAVKTATVPIPKNTDHVFINDTNGVIDNNDKKPVEADDAPLGKSENYRIKDIVIGSGTMVLAGETENLPIKVTDVRSQLMSSKDGESSSLLVTWRTNKLAKSQVKYQKDGSAERSLNEGGYGFSHALVLSQLDQQSRYSFSVQATDRAGNSSDSGIFSTFTGSKAVSVFDLISQQMDQIFGWAIRK